MAAPAKVAPITKSIRVRATTEKAFQVFTTNVIKWWPPAYTIGKSRMTAVIIEPVVGGRWFEIGEDGSECQWGDVLAWNPPSGLVLAWRIGMDWRFDPALLTEVAVNFHEVADGETDVTIVHSRFENYGPDTDKALQIFDGWSSTLLRFADVVHGHPPREQP